MNLNERITLMVKLDEYLKEESAELKAVKEKAFQKNKWFTPAFIDFSFHQISKHYLDKNKLEDWIEYYHIDDNIQPQKVGVIMAGNIPLVGFHDFLCVFITGHYQFIKLSDKDDILLKHLIEKMIEWQPVVSEFVNISQLLKDCDAYIATGSNNSARYFNYYFGKFPSIIRKNKTSVAVITGNETAEDLTCLADDVFIYFGLGCRNVTKILVPKQYEFEKMLEVFKKYDYFSDITSYRNNYDYNLALLIMNNKFYMSTPAIILSENDNDFSPISVLHYSYYQDKKEIEPILKSDENIQCIVGPDFIPFGKAQEPGLFDYADGIDTIQFLLSL
ncbi:MAG: acyl-CoA reductase [Ginsengibacter sp.]